jgi:hypothetical protein
VPLAVSLVMYESTVSCGAEYIGFQGIVTESEIGYVQHTEVCIVY